MLVYKRVGISSNGGTPWMDDLEKKTIKTKMANWIQ